MLVYLGGILVVCQDVLGYVWLCLGMLEHVGYVEIFWGMVGYDVYYWGMLGNGEVLWNVFGYVRVCLGMLD